MNGAADLAGKHALVTGGGTGLGAAVALALADAGARVTITGRRPEPLAEVAAGRADIRTATGDVTRPDEVAAMFADAAAEWGAPQIVVANAGAAESKPFRKVSPSEFDAILAVNLGGVFNTFQAALPAMLDAGAGRLIAMASIAGLKGAPYITAYCAAKHGVIGLTRALALEVAKSGVTVNAVCPGYTRTPMLERTLANVMAKTGRSRAEAESAVATAQGRIIEPDEVASAVLWLCGDGAVSVTGQAIAISGGEP
jgi:NAD(P)-dependent dehydrogenase (short-subunit alcohol dehydrogenase family)